MKDIIEDIKIIISNNYLFTVAIMLFSVATIVFPWWVYVIMTLALPMIYYVIIHNLGKIAFNKEIGLPDFKSNGFKMLLRHQLFWISLWVVFIVLLVFVSYLLYDPTEVNTEATQSSSLIKDIVFEILYIVAGVILMIMSFGVFTVIYSCCIFPDTNVEYVNSITNAGTIHNTFPKHWYYWMVGLGFIYYVNMFVALTLLCYVSMAYTLRYILNTPPNKKEKVKQHKLCESM